MKKISNLASALILFTTLLNADITIKNGWQLLGATQDMNTSIFNNTCVDYIWKYDATDINNTQWKIHVANAVEYNHNMTPITSLTKGEGYWVKGNGDCTVVNTSSGNVTYSPLKRWAHNGNGTITDTTTGLIWYHRGNTFFGYFAWDPSDVLNNSNVTSWISSMQNGYPGDLTDGSSRYEWRLPTVKEMLELTSGVEAISPSTQYFFTGIQTDWYWTCSQYINPIPMKIMRIQMPESDGFGTPEIPHALYWGLAVRSP